MQQSDTAGLRQFQARLLDAETRASPNEFKAFIRSLRANPDTAPLLGVNETYDVLMRSWRLQPFVAEDLGADVTLFRGKSSARERHLLVAMTAMLGRVTIATPAFLQCVSARKWDVLMLRDSARTHYRRGCAGYADSFPGLAAKVQGLAKDYAGCCVMGTSIGGLAAIRLALQIPKARGVSVGGRPVADIARLFDDPFAGLAFDPLCACLPKARRDLIFVYGDDNRNDRRTAQQFARITGGHACGLPQIATHGFLADIWRNGRLAVFLATALNQQVRGQNLISAMIKAVG